MVITFKLPNGMQNNDQQWAEILMLNSNFISQIDISWRNKL